MLRAYMVCGYCFEKIDIAFGSRCTCLASKNKPTIFVTRFEESIDTQLNEDYPNIVGQDEWGVSKELCGPIEGSSKDVPEAFLGAQVILSSDIQLCEGCQQDFQEACNWITQIINHCMAEQVKDTFDGSKSPKENKTSIGSSPDFIGDKPADYDITNYEEDDEDTL